MKLFTTLSAVLLIALSVGMSDAEAARRLGGGKSLGMQREAVTQKAPMSTPSQAGAANAARPPAAAPAPAPQRSWLGPLAGLAAGIGLAALASHFGFGQELASMMMFGLLAMVVIGVIGYFMRRKAASQPGLAAAGAGGAPSMPFEANQYAGGSAAQPQQNQFAANSLPADFDAEAFSRVAKVNFIRLQAANDAGNLDDIRQFTTPEMFAEFKLALAERGTQPLTTDVVHVDAQVIDVAEDAQQYIVSVRFTGQIREDGGPVEAFDEVWNMIKPRSGQSGWVLAGIQQR